MRILIARRKMTATAFFFEPLKTVHYPIWCGYKKAAERLESK